MTTIVALDPGGTTGFAVYREERDNDAANLRYGGSWRAGHIGPEEHHVELWNFLAKLQQHDENLTVVCESFEFRQGKQRANINLMSKEYIGVAKLFGTVWGIPVVFQTAAQGKGFASDEKLKVMGLYTPGKKHAMDAMRHLVTYMITKRRRHDLMESWKSLPLS
jgi:hypothetical protein